MRFEGRILRSGSWWAADVPLLGVSTQGRTKNEAFAMVEDAIASLASPLHISVHIVAVSRDRFEVGSSKQDALVAFFLRRQRQMSGLSLSAVSRRLGLKSRNAYARYEQGKAAPTLRKLDELLKALAPDRDFVLRESA